MYSTERLQRVTEKVECAGANTDHSRGREPLAAAKEKGLTFLVSPSIFFTFLLLHFNSNSSVHRSVPVAIIWHQWL